MTEDTYTFTTRSSSPAYSLEYSDDPSAFNPVDIPSDVEDEIFVHGHSGQGHQITAQVLQTTPKQVVMVLPPTPTESLRDWDSSQDGGAEPIPPSPWIPVIPDPEAFEEWETVNAEEAEAPTPPPKDTPPDGKEEGSDSASLSAPSTIAPTPTVPIADSAPEADSDPAPEAPPSGPAPQTDDDPPPPEEPAQQEEPVIPPAPETDPADPPQDPPPVESNRTPPPAFEELYGEDGFPKPDIASGSKPPSERAGTPPVPSPTPSVRIKHALSLRKEAIELTARISSLKRQRKASIAERTSAATTAAMITKMDIERAEKELAELNEKAEGAFVGAYNPPSASLYEFNTTGLTPEEAVRQTEARLGKLLLTPVPPAGTTPEDLAHDSPNRGALKVVMDKSIKGRLVKRDLLAALSESGLNWTEDTSRPSIIYILLPVMPDEPVPSTEPEPTADSGKDKKDDNDEAKDEALEY